MKLHFIECFFYWAPRLLSLGFILFISVFSLDVFSEYSGVGIVLPLIIHLLPSVVLLLITAVAWRYELVGAVAFIGFATLYVLDVGLTRPLSWYLGIVLPAYLVGLFYLISWFKK